MAENKEKAAIEVEAPAAEALEDEKKVFVADRRVKTVTTIDKKTPMGQTMVRVTYVNGHSEIMPLKRYEIVKTYKASDATTVRNKLMKEVGGYIYGMLHEYGFRHGEVNPTLDEVVNLTNAATARATNMLFGVEYADERSLLDINDILMRNFTTNEPEPAQDGDDGAQTAGGGADTPDQA